MRPRLQPARSTLSQWLHPAYFRPTTLAFLIFATMDGIFSGHVDERVQRGRMRHSGDGRDANGNLPGGQMNQSMQNRVVGDTIEDIAARRQRAEQDAAAHANFPRFMELNDVQLPLYKWTELEDLGKQTLKKRALTFRDMIEQSGCKFFENHAHLKLNAAQGEDKILEWYINVQVTIAAALGLHELDHAAFGAPHLAGSLPEPSANNRNRNAPPPQAQQRQMSQQQYEQMMMQQQQQQQMQQQMQMQQQQQMMMMQQQQYRQENDDYQNRPPPSRGQPQKAPPSRGMHDNSDPNASRFDDAARIRAKNAGGSNIFG